MNGKFLSIVRVVVSAALIIILLYIMRDKYGYILEALKGTSVNLFLLGLAVFIAAISIASIRLKLIIDIQGIPIRYMEALSLTFIGYFFNNFLPTAIGGDVVKGYYLSKKTTHKTNAFAAVFVDRVIGLVTMIFMATIALLFAGNQIIDPNVRYSIYLITALAIVGIIFATNKNVARKLFKAMFFLKPLEEKLKKGYNMIHKYQYHKILMLQSLAISIISQLFFFASLGILAWSIGSRIPAMQVCLRTPIISALSLLPSINGLGLREGSTVMLFGPIIGNAQAFAVSILWLAVLLIVSVGGGIVYGFSPQFRVKLQEIKQ